VWLGVVLWAVGLLVGKEQASRLESMVGGRVCPMQLPTDTTTTSSSSPFLLLVHHHHRFPWWDVLGRRLTRQFLPEGFPAHPHRGFTTLTYMLQGGFTHRDSMGIRQDYGAEGTEPHSAQWLFTGAGLLHEEMFHNHRPWNENVQELYQIWINVPAVHKLDPPETLLLEDMPTVTSSHVSQQIQEGGRSCCVTTKTRVRVLAGTYRDNHDRNSVHRSEAPVMSDLHVLHVTISTGRNRRSERRVDVSDRTDVATTVATSRPVGWTYEIPSGFDTVLMYIRQGSCHVTVQSVQRRQEQQQQQGQTTAPPPQRVPIHSTVFVEPSTVQPSGSVRRERLVVAPESVGEGVDLLLLAGRPLYERYGPDGVATTTVEPVAMKVIIKGMLLLCVCVCVCVCKMRGSCRHCLS
jgi:redox-sensitive bicupin YhaK (pirin superfamily)